MQQFLYRATRDPEALRDDLRDYVVAPLGDPAGILVVDATGFLNQGDKSAGVQSPYSGTAGRTAPCSAACPASARSSRPRCSRNCRNSGG